MCSRSSGAGQLARWPSGDARTHRVILAPAALSYQQYVQGVSASSSGVRLLPGRIPDRHAGSRAGNRQLATANS